MKGTQLLGLILQLALATVVIADTNNVSPHIPYAIYPARSGRQSGYTEDEILPVTQIPGGAVDGKTQQPPQDELEEEIITRKPSDEESRENPVVPQELEQGPPSDEENLKNPVVPQDLEQGPPLNPKDIPRILKEKEELLKKIKFLEEANRNLRLGERRGPARRRNGTSTNDGIINTLDGTDEKGIVTTRPVDCADHLVLGATRSGVYEIYPFTCLCSKPVQVYCDMETDGGGWTVFLTRRDYVSPTNFNRSWSDYRAGFGDPAAEYWLGNELLYTMTSSREYALRMDIELTTGDTKSALWKTVSVGTEVDRYKILLGTYSAESTTYSNCFPSISGQHFTSNDRDYDKTAGNCATTYGGFWHYYCSNTVHPTGPHGKGLISTCFNQQRLAASYMQLKIRPVICGSTFKTVYLNSYDCDSCH